MEVLEIALDGRTSSERNMVRVKGGSIISSNPNCTRSPFTFSSENSFVSFGCNIIATITETGQQVVGCKSRCNTSLLNGAHFASTDNKVLEGCNYAFLSDNSRPEIESFNTLEKLGFVPVVLDWQIYTGPMVGVRCLIPPKIDETSIVIFSSFCYYGSIDDFVDNFISNQCPEDISSLKCNCAGGYEGNPYLSAGCEETMKLMSFDVKGATSLLDLENI
ncbi:hypothetical protein CFP56_036402 [Quercus suber]|uniref:Uncharacterized protein n=1 Tax=Quercus suber TaxID=58331 RepID=A0AAW0LQ92_QUESU